MNPLLWLGATAFIAMGVCAYTDVWKNWARVARGFGTTIGFAWLHHGIGLTLMNLGVVFTQTQRTVFLVLFAASFAFILFAMIGFWWLPSALLPEWFKKARAATLSREKRAKR